MSNQTKRIKIESWRLTQQLVEFFLKLSPKNAVMDAEDSVYLDSSNTHILEVGRTEPWLDQLSTRIVPVEKIKDEKNQLNLLQNCDWTDSARENKK